MSLHQRLRRSAAKDKTYVLIGNIVIFVWILAFYLYNWDVINGVFAYVTILAICLSGVSSAYSLAELCRRMLR